MHSLCYAFPVIFKLTAPRFTPYYHIRSYTCRPLVYYYVIIGIYSTVIFIYLNSLPAIFDMYNKPAYLYLDKIIKIVIDMIIYYDLLLSYQITKRDNKMQTTIPFQGFYESIHSMQIYNYIESEIDQGYIKDADHIDYVELNQNYAKEYVNILSIESGIDLKFDRITSPREYNFETDVIHCTIDDRQFRTLCAHAHRKHLEEIIKERCTSRSGFHSFYSNDLNDWLENGKADLSHWDHNQVGLLIESVILNELGEDFEHDICYQILINELF